MTTLFDLGLGKACNSSLIEAKTINGPVIYVGSHTLLVFSTKIYAL